MKLKNFFCQFPNPWTIRVSGMGGYTSKCEKSQNHCTLINMSDNWNKEAYMVSKQLSQRAFSGFYSNFVSLILIFSFCTWTEWVKTVQCFAWKVISNLKKMVPGEPQRPYRKERWPGQAFTFWLFTWIFFKNEKLSNGTDFNVSFMVYQKIIYLLMFSSQLHALKGSNTNT